MCTTRTTGDALLLRFMMVLLLVVHPCIVVVDGWWTAPTQTSSSPSWNSMVVIKTPRRTKKRNSKSTSSNSFGAPLQMGLYDTPLPPRQPPNSQKNESSTAAAGSNNDSWNESQTGKDDNDEEETLSVTMITERLFQFDENGKEVHDWLPPLKRRWVHGIGCYYEPTDRIVINLIDKTSVHPEDACWALEACNGDITEAWTRISTARRIKLEQQRTSSSSIIHEDDMVSSQNAEDDELLWQEFQNRKQTFERRQHKQQRGYFDDGKTSVPPQPDQPWLPNPNPRPIDDEPWFTG